MPWLGHLTLARVQRDDSIDPLSLPDPPYAAEVGESAEMVMNAIVSLNSEDEISEGSQLGSELIIFEKPYAPAALFVPGACDPLLDHIKKSVKSEVTDPSTPDGRKRIVSLAMKVTKTKTAIDAARKTLVADEKKRLSAIDAEGKRLWDELESFAKEVRQPVTDFENREKERIAKHEDRLAELKSIGEFTSGPGVATYAPDTATISYRLLAAQEFDVSGFEEFVTLATGTRAQVVEALTERLAASRKADADRAELERLRSEQAAREQKERDEVIAAKARKDAEDEARRREEEARAAAAEDLARIEREKKDAENRALRAEQDRIAAAQKADKDRIAAEADAKRREQEAAGRERARIAAEQKAEADALAKREADKVHKAKINREILTGLMTKITIGMNEILAKAIITSIAKGEIPNIKILY